MAKEEKEEQEEQEEGKAKGGSKVKLIIFAVVGTLLLGGGLVGGTLYFTGAMEPDSAETAEGEEEEGEETEMAAPMGPPMYHTLDPKFVVSFRDQRVARFMQFELDVMTRSDDTVMQIESHISAIRSSLIMLFDSQDHVMMSTKEGKTKLLMEVTNDVNATINRMAAEGSEDAAVEAAYFTSFVIQ